MYREPSQVMLALRVGQVVRKVQFYVYIGSVGHFENVRGTLNVYIIILGWYPKCLLLQTRVGTWSKMPNSCLRNL